MASLPITKATLTTAAILAAVVLYEDVAICRAALVAAILHNARQSSQKDAYQAIFPLAASLYRGLSRVERWRGGVGFDMVCFGVSPAVSQ